MPVKKHEVPDALKALLPEDHVELVVVGSTCYELAPLTAGKAEVVLKELVEVIIRSFSELTKITDLPEGNTKNIQDVAELTKALKKGLEATIAEGRIIRIVATALDLTEDIIRAEATIKQLHHIVGMLWKQNFDMGNVAEDSRKNFDGLLVALSLKNRDDIVYQWADYALRVLPNPMAGSLTERIDLVLHLAADLTMIEKTEVEKYIQSRESTPILPSTPGSTENTSAVKEESSVNSQEIPADGGTT